MSEKPLGKRLLGPVLPLLWAFALIGTGAAAFWAGMQYSPMNRPVTINHVTGPCNNLIVEGEDLIGLYSEISPSVVSVTAQRWVEGNSLSRHGSGFFIDNMHIVTNHHVVDLAEHLEIELRDGSKHIAELIGQDAYSDLSVLRIGEDTGIRPLTLANSSATEPGTAVAALGSPFGLKGSITSGIVSATGRILRTQGEFMIVNVLQTDAPINPGNSGGPLVNMDGLVVGVNIAREGDNIGFAIPSDMVLRIVPKLIAEGQYNHPWIGIVAQPVTKNLADQLGLEHARGLQILRVNEGGPADMAGLRGCDKLRTHEGIQIASGGDIITHIEDEPMDSFNDLMNYLESSTEVGQKVVVSFVREGETHNATLTIGERP